MVKRKIIAILIATNVLALAGCSSVADLTATNKVVENAEVLAEQSSEENISSFLEEMNEEQTQISLENEDSNETDTQNLDEEFIENVKVPTKEYTNQINGIELQGIIEGEMCDNITVNEYLYETDGKIVGCYLAITNNSDKDISIKGEAVVLDNTDFYYDETVFDIDVIGTNEESWCVMKFNESNTAQKIEYKIVCEEETEYKPVINGLEIKQQENENEILFNVKNNGQFEAQFVELLALFFNEKGNVIDYTYTYPGDGIYNSIEPGKTEIDSVYKPYEYDTYKIFVKGRYEL